MPRETYLHLGVVGCHAKAHQAEGHELLLVDVHVGPGVVLGKRAAGSGLREGLGPYVSSPSGTEQESPAQGAEDTRRPRPPAGRKRPSDSPCA